MAQWVLDRELSVHCLVLKEKEISWRPKPFRVFNGWREFAGYSDFVKAQWEGMEVKQWSSFVVKVKLKRLKQ